MKVPFLNVQML